MMDAEIKALVIACRANPKFGNSDKAHRGILFAFRKEWDDQVAAEKKAAPVAPSEPTTPE